MSVIDKYKKIDAEITNFCDFLNTTSYIQNKGSITPTSLFNCIYNKIGVFEENNKIYKVFTISNWKQQKAIQILCQDILKISEIVLPFKVVFEGQFFIIVEQKKLTLIKERQQIQKSYIKDLTSLFIPNMDKDVNKFLIQTTNREIYIKFKKLIELLKTRDLVIYNFGFNEFEKLQCFDIENHNQNISFLELKEFIENNSNFKLKEILEIYPELLVLVSD